MNTLESTSTSTSIAPLLTDLHQRAGAHYGARLACLVLFGSQARGDAVGGSDVDVLAVLHGGAQPGDDTFASDLTYDLLLRYEVSVSLLHASHDRYLHEQSPLMINIRREGMLLTGRDTLQPLLHTATQHQHSQHQHNDNERMITTTMIPEQHALLRRAEESLRGARLMANDCLYGFAISRAYYAMFYVAQAFLLSKGLSFSKHSAVIAAFGKHFAHPRIVPVEFHRQLKNAQDARLIGDYAPDIDLTREDADLYIAYAETFIGVARRVLGDG